MHKYQGKYQSPRPKRRPFLYIGLGCAALALLAAAYVGLFFWTGAQRKQASRQTAMEYVVTLPTRPPQETEPGTQTTAPSETTVPETTAETQPPRRFIQAAGGDVQPGPAHGGHGEGLAEAVHGIPPLPVHPVIAGDPLPLPAVNAGFKGG